ncbi:MAG: APC family permease, partial [Blastococcus sp.]
MIRRDGGLRQGALGGADSVVMAVAGSAPAYSIAATTAVLVGAVGLASPAALLYCAIPMLGIAWAFNYLGRADVNAGASYSWVGRALHPSLGFISGWALIVSATIFMVAGSLPAGSLTLSLFSDSRANNTALVTLVGACWFLLRVGLVIAGVTVTAKAQWIMTGIEVTLLVLFGVLAFAHGAGAGSHFSWSWFGFGGFGGISGFAGGALVAAFYFWGWDVTANLNEETEGGGRKAGLGGLIGVVLVFLLFEVFTIATNVLLTPKEIDSNAGNVLARLGEVVWPGAGGKVLIVAVMLSTIATL